MKISEIISWILVIVLGSMSYFQTEEIEDHQDDLQALREELTEAGKAKIKELEEKLTEASRIGIEFKERLDDARAEVADLQSKLGNNYTDRTVAPVGNAVSDYDPSLKREQRLNDERERREAAAKVTEARIKLNRAYGILRDIKSENPRFKEHSRGYSKGIRTSDADRQKWYDAHDRRVASAESQVRQLEDELARLESQVSR